MCRSLCFFVALVLALGATPLVAAPPVDGGQAATAGDVKPATSADPSAEKPAGGDASQATEAPAVERAKLTEDITVEAKRLSEELVYSVTRVPERTFETPRAVQVITAEQIQRKAAFELSDVLMQEAGFFISPAGNGGGSVIVRGLASRQVLVMIDGVKLNNTTWRTFSDVKEHFNLIDPSEIERIEIVRGVVSVLGSEALGGVVNIITKKGPEGPQRFGASVSTRYSSADRGEALALQLNGQGERYRYIAGVNGLQTSDLTIGGGTELPNTAYRRRGGHASVDFFPTTEKTLSLGYRAFERTNKYLSFLASPAIADGDIDPMRMQMATLRYSDVISRPWQDSLTATASWNRQDDGRNYVLRTPLIHRFFDNCDTMVGLNVEAGKFIHSHHLIYGVDHSRERVASSLLSLVGTAELPVRGRGDYLDGGRYDATAIYLNDQLSLSKWLTITAGARYGRYVSSGSEVVPAIGPFDAASTKSNVTSSLNVVVHATDNLNFVGNYVRGYRPPNMHDMTSAAVTTATASIPDADLEAERMNSFEAGLKYDSGWLYGSAFYYDNDLSNLLVNGPGLYKGLSFLDLNDDGQRQPLEPLVLTTTNIGKATVKGYELDIRYIPTANLTLWGNYANTKGTNNDARQSLSRIQPRLANVGARLATNGEHRAWVEGILTYGSDSVGPTGDHFRGFHVYTLRGGTNLNRQVSLTVAVENVFDTHYQFVPSQSLIPQPGRQAVLVTDVHF